MNRKLPKAFVDLHRLSEDERIVVIGDYCLAHPSEKVAVPTDDEPGKPERYKRKIETKYPQLRVEIVGPLTPGSILLRVTCSPGE
jgi:hypothetical protein